MPRTLLMRSARVLDIASGPYLEDHDGLIDDGRIAELGRGLRAPDAADVFDVRGATLIPGLVDAHVHVTAATADLAAMTAWSTSYVTAHSAGILRGMLERGFTTVRDARSEEHTSELQSRQYLV